MHASAVAWLLELLELLELVEFLKLLVDLGLRRRRRAFEEVEIAAVVRLADVVLVQRAEAASEMRLRLAPFASPARELRIVDLELQAAGRDVEHDDVTVADE